MKIITLRLDGDVVVLLDLRRSWTRECISAYRTKTRQQANIRGVVEAMLSQVGEKKREQDWRMESERLLEQMRWPACLQQPWSFHLRSSGFYIPAMHHRSHHAEETCIGLFTQDRTVQRFSKWGLGVKSGRLGSP